MVVPLYNEEATVEAILRKVVARPEVGEVIVVDDGSTDRSAAVVRSLGLEKIRLLSQEKNQGKGAAVRRGFSEIRCEYVVIQDADLEYEPADYPAMLAPLVAGQADAVYGSRFAAGYPEAMKPLYYAANRFLTAASNRVTGLGLTDMLSCYKVLRRELLEKLALREDRFGLEAEMTAELARLGARVVELPISYRARRREEGKKIRWTDGLRVVGVIWRSRPGAAGRS